MQKLQSFTFLSTNSLPGRLHAVYFRYKNSRLKPELSWVDEVKIIAAAADWRN